MGREVELNPPPPRPKSGRSTPRSYTRRQEGGSESPVQRQAHPISGWRLEPDDFNRLARLSSCSKLAGYDGGPGVWRAPREGGERCRRVSSSSAPAPPAACPPNRFPQDPTTRRVRS